MIACLKPVHLIILPIVISMICSCHVTPESRIRINQLGYPPGSVKVAVLGTKTPQEISRFRIIDARSNDVVWTGDSVSAYGAYGPFSHTWRLRFTQFEDTGSYYISCAGVRSPVFRISHDVYAGISDFLLQYLRQQRCGFNPFLNDSCHTQDGYMIYAPLPDGTPIDATGGWHDAGDYLQYVATSANATFHLLLAWQDHRMVFADSRLGTGLPGKNQLADVLDEARWGLEWLLKMHPRPDMMFNQIADDRDHAGFRLPTEDTIRYGNHPGRPVYFCSGEPQGLYKYRNRSTGKASTAGKFSSAFSMGSEVFTSIDPALSDILSRKALSAYQIGVADTGVCQTAPCRAPYFYEEDNWVDDMELAAACLYRQTGNSIYRDGAIEYGMREPVTPWMGADTARHYQWYPFFNPGHAVISRTMDYAERERFMGFYRRGIRLVFERGRDNAFQMGVPYIWCSNNLVSSFLAQCYLYRTITGDRRFIEIESAMRDWLLGCNPWGTSMITGLPPDGEFPEDVHSAFSHLYGLPVDGGLVDGPVYGSIYRSLKYVHLTDPDEFAPFQSDLVVYHDDVGDYSTNEHTMDGTAGLVYYFSAMEEEALRGRVTARRENTVSAHGAVIRGDTTKSRVALLFSGDQYADGAEMILNTLREYGISASFFFTGNFYRNPQFQAFIEQARRDGHYLGAHSDAHLLYCDWSDRDRLLVDRRTFLDDLYRNYLEMRTFGIDPHQAPFFLPPYEWYNREIAGWSIDEGIQLISFTPGTLTQADYTIPSMGDRYAGSKEILDSIREYEDASGCGLNGFIFLMHIGTESSRRDKFYHYLPDLIEFLKENDYQPVLIDQLLKTPSRSDIPCFYF